jgi:hypothetical protein
VFGWRKRYREGSLAPVDAAPLTVAEDQFHTTPAGNHVVVDQRSSGASIKLGSSLWSLVRQRTAVRYDPLTGCTG